MQLLVLLRSINILPLYAYNTDAGSKKKKKRVIGLEQNVLFFFYEGVEETNVERGLVVIFFAVNFFSFDIIYYSYYKLFLPPFWAVSLRILGKFETV